VNNVEIPNSKRVEISLQYIYGIGSTTAKQILVNTVSDRGDATAAGSRSSRGSYTVKTQQEGQRMTGNSWARVALLCDSWARQQSGWQRQKRALW
jgi:hypothetical protein